MRLRGIALTMWFVPLALIGSIAGCGGDAWAAKRPTPVPVSGTVRHDGKPVAGATVIFVPSGHTNAAAGETDAEGRFSLRTFEPDDGAVPGEYKVAVRKVEVVGGAPADAGDDAAAAPPEERWLLPGRYSVATTSGLTATVTEEGADDLVFELSGSAGPPSAAPAARATSSSE